MSLILLTADDQLCDSDDEESNPEETNPTETTDYDIKAKFSFLFGHPEDFLDKVNLEVFRKAKWSNQVKFIIVDEAHCVVQWSADFRPKYRDLGDLSSFFPTSRIIALTATATVKMQKEISRYINMKEPLTVTAQLDRPNISYHVYTRPANTGRTDNAVEASYTKVFAPLIDELKVQTNFFPKTVVYAPLKWCGFGNELGVKLINDGRITSCGNHEIAQFHAPLTAEVS